ncbi:MAG: DUF1194 domain-containing protein [Alphaproteobacteria bacterium]|nr:DUF1194 domain-containing protein [Alphaproteobacteria bacterium]MCW5738770.1 DUF1194 domain-containing protein [Alphaproteobacteria bacterium]
MADSPARRRPLAWLLAALVALSLAGGVPALAQSAKSHTPDGEIDLALALAIDVSGSVDLEEGRLQRDGYVKAFRDPAIRRAILGGYHGRIAVAYFEWSDAWRQNLVVDWTLLDSEQSIEAFTHKLETLPIARMMRTSITGAMRYAVPMFDRLRWVPERKVLDISGDGSNNDGGMVTQARDDAVARGITINGLPIFNNRPNPTGFPNDPDLDRYYEGCVIGGPRSFMVVANDFQSFAEAIRKKLLQEIADVAPEPRAGLQFAQSRDSAMGVRDPHGPGPGGHRRYQHGCDVGEKRTREFYRRYQPN